MLKFLITLFFGYFGVHKFMEKKIGMGFLYFFTLGLFGIGWIYDVIMAAKALKPSPKLPVSSSGTDFTIENFHLAGVSYYLDNIKKLACSNEDYRKSTKTLANNNLVMKRIYQYNYINKPVKLIPEPQNPHDKNAIAVYIAGELVGYISRDENIHVKDILDHYQIQFISSFIGGGRYKIVMDSNRVEICDENISINVRIGYH